MLKENFKEAAIDLIYANRNENEIYLLNELNEMTKKLNLRVEYFVDKLSDAKESNAFDVKSLKLGLIQKSDLLKFEKYNSDPETLVLLCGSDKMCNEYLKPAFLDMKFKKENVFIF